MELTVEDAFVFCCDTSASVRSIVSYRRMSGIVQNKASTIGICGSITAEYDGSVISGTSNNFGNTLVWTYG